MADHNSTGTSNNPQAALGRESPRQPLSKAETAAMVAELERTGDYRVLRRLVPLPLHRCRQSDGLRCAIVIDTETTGLVLPGGCSGNVPSEIISLAMVAVAYNPITGEIKGTVGRFHQLREPSHPIPTAATAIHGISDEHVRGRSISSDDVGEWIALTLAGVQRGVEFGSHDEERLPLLIAHNAEFDRRMMEALFPDVVADLPWACSQTQIAWADYGFEGTKLNYLGQHAGFFYGNRHSALADADAVVQLMRQPLDGRFALARLREAAQQSSYRLSVFTRYDPRIIAALKARGYRWSNGAGGRPRAWFWEGDEGRLAEELEYLRLADLGETREVKTLDCFDRFSCRA